MNRIATSLIVFAMAVTATSVAVVLSIQFGMPVTLAAAIALSLMFALGLAHVIMERRRDRRWFEARIAEIAAVAGDVNTEVGRVSARLGKLDGQISDRVREENEGLAAEVEVLGHLMKQIADTLADLEITVDRRFAEVSSRAEAPRLAAPPAPAPAERRSDPEPRVEPRRDPFAAPPADGRIEPVLETPRAEPAVETARVPTAFEREVEAAIRAERIEIHLQPVVTLPQRKVRYYEVLTRLRAADGSLIPAGEFLTVAEKRGLLSRLDTFQVIRAFQILKRLTARNRDVGLSVNVASASLADTAFFREFSAFLNQNRAMADLVQFEFTQEAVREMGPLELESLAAIADLGYRFSVDNVTDLSADFRALADRGFRTVKLSVDRLLGRSPVRGGDIHPADLSGHLQRQGLALVVDRIETEAEVLDLLDYDIRLAQGFLFSAPRQVRPEILGAAPAAAGQPAQKAAGR